MALTIRPMRAKIFECVGIDTFVKIVDGELLAEDDPLLNRRAMNEQMTVRTRYFDDSSPTQRVPASSRR